MKSTAIEKVIFNIQVVLIKTMYWKYWTYRAVMTSLYLYFPVYLIWLVLSGKIKTASKYYERLSYYYHNIEDNTSIVSYNKNKIRRKREIREKLKDT